MSQFYEYEVYPFEDILNVMPIHQYLYTSGQPTVGQFKLIKEQGFSIIINLVLTDSVYALLNEDRICLELGLDYMHLPLLWDNPNPNMGVFILDTIYFLTQEQRVWVHCANNYCVSCLMLLYQQFYLGINLETSLERLEQIWQPDETWTGFIYAVQLQLQARKSTFDIQQCMYG